MELVSQIYRSAIAFSCARWINAYSWKSEQGNVEQVNLLYLLIKLHDYNPYNQKIPYIADLFFFMDGFEYSLWSR